MSTSLLYHSFGIRGYQYTRTDYHDGQVIFTIRQDPKACRCPACGSSEVRSRGRVERRFRSLPIGSRATFVALPIPRVECQQLGGHVLIVGDDYPILEHDGRHARPVLTGEPTQAPLP